MQSLIRNLMALALMACPWVALSQVDQNTGERENYVLNANGQVLIVKSPVNNESTLVRREANGSENTIVSHGQSLGGGTLDGIGAQPHMNAGGVAAFQAVITGSSNESGIFTGVPGSVTTIAAPGDDVAGETVCNAEPYPLINSSNQVFWGTTVEGGAGQDTCDPDGDDPNSRKAIYRFTPPSTNALLLVADYDGFNSPDQVTAPGATTIGDFGTDTYTLTDAHLIAHGGDAVTSSGAALVTAWLDSDTSSGDNRERTSLLYVSPGSISMVAMDDDDGAAPGDDSPFAEVGKGIANASGLVFFKGQAAESGTAGERASLNFWSGGSWSELVAGGDALPVGAGSFQGFPPTMDLNAMGGAAFTAGLDITANCGGGLLNTAGDFCRGIYISPDGNSIVELARTSVASDEAGGVGTDSASGFEFDELGSVAVLADDGRVYFQAENQNPDVECGSPSGGTAFGGGEVTGIFSASSGSAPQKVIAEGDQLTDGRVMRLFTPMPELRQHEANDNFAIRTWIDTNDDCVSDTEQIFLASMFPIIPSEQIPIPALGPWGAWLLVALLALVAGLRLLRRA